LNTGNASAEARGVLRDVRRRCVGVHEGAKVENSWWLGACPQGSSAKLARGDYPDKNHSPLALSSAELFVNAT
jgi:hypothetical protein